MSEQQFQQQLQEWQNAQPPETQKQGNSMTQHYYSQCVLPQHIYHIRQQKNAGYPAVLMEDGDPSHGHRSISNLPAQQRKEQFVQLHDHPPQSPDLNPIEGVWLLLNELLRQQHGQDLHKMTYWQLRKAVEACWASITVDQIRERIKDLPRRCRYISKCNGGRVKGEKW